MSKRLFGLTLTLMALVAGACTGGEEAAPSPTATETTAAPASPAATVQTVNGCEIKPRTDCSGASLHGADLRAAELERSTLSDADLSEAMLHRANLRSADLHRADLQGANLSEAKLENADLSEANLGHANLSYANLKGADVTDASLANAYLCGTVMADGTEDSSSCASPSPSPHPTASPSPAADKVVITEFDMQAIHHCPQPDQPVVVAFYGTKNAAKVEFSDVDLAVNPPPKKTSGKVVLNFNCPEKNKPYSQTYTMTAIGADGTKVTRTATVTAKFKD